MASSNRVLGKYGIPWREGESDLEIERYMIRREGRFTQDGKEYGEGLFHHYRELQKALWPEDDHHRWSDLTLRRILENDITVLMGSKDANKTYSMSRFILCDWWCFPDDTLWLVSSTEYRGSELRIWGHIKGLYNRAKARFPELEGQVLEYMHAITNDEIDDDRQLARSLQRGLILVPCKKGSQNVGLSAFIGCKAPRLRHAGDECFPAGTMVDTPNGKRPIESIKVGDVVINATGSGIVQRNIKRTAAQLVTVTAQDGRAVTCTPEHPFLTQKGWVKAYELNQESYMMAPYEAMQTLRRTIPTHQSRCPLQILHREAENENMPLVQKGVHGFGCFQEAAILHPFLRRQMEVESAGSKEGARLEKIRLLKGSGVDRVKIHKSRDTGELGGSRNDVEVYNLEVSGHPSYSVNGFIVHNCSLMSEGFLDAYANWHGKENFKGIMSGNPTDLLDPLCKAARPIGGWEGWTDTRKTQEWRSEFFDAWVIALDGRDSPNYDFPDTPKCKYPYMISRKGVEAVVKTFGADSWQAYMQGYGKPNRMLSGKRVITQLLCEQHLALETAIWKGADTKLVYGLDPAYGGGDRCIGILLEFGAGLDGKEILKVSPPELVPVSVNAKKEPEDQIADWIKTRLDQLGIPATSCFYGAFGKGTLGNAFARVFGNKCPVPIDEGGRPSKRPVRSDLYTDDPVNGRRHVRADEYYSKRISELWYSCRLAIESDQIRELPRSTMQEGCLRVFEIVHGNKIEVESKVDLKKRMQGESPNEFDAFALGLEGARQLGFRIDKLGEDSAADPDKFAFNKLQEEYDAAMNKRRLVYG